MARKLCKNKNKGTRWTSHSCFMLLLSEISKNSWRQCHHQPHEMSSNCFTLSRPFHHLKHQPIRWQPDPLLLKTAHCIFGCCFCWRKWEVVIVADYLELVQETNLACIIKPFEFRARMALWLFRGTNITITLLHLKNKFSSIAST